MFTGIVVEVGKVRQIQNLGTSKKFIIECKKVLEDVNLGDSISTNGVCLTVEKITPTTFQAHIMMQTITMSNFKDISVGSSVNLERAMLPTTRFGGHIVSGHVDYTASVQTINKNKSNTIYTFKIDTTAMDYIIDQGSVSINGISLTTFGCTKDTFKVSLIPETLNRTNLIHLKHGDIVNIETDIIAKYINNLTRRSR